MHIDLYLQIYKPAEIANSGKLASYIISLLLLLLGSVSAAEISNEAYHEIKFLATNQKYQTELKKKQRLAEF